MPNKVIYFDQNKPHYAQSVIEYLENEKVNLIPKNLENLPEGALFCHS